MYESPIELFDVADYTKKVNDEIDNYVYEYIVNLGINVNKEELIKALQYDRDQYEKGYKDGQKEALKYVVSRWIPVTERLPEEGERVLATHLGGIIPNRQVIEHIYENGQFTCNWYIDMDITSPTAGQRFMGDVVAWMPLPKPYDEGEEKE